MVPQEATRRPSAELESISKQLEEIKGKLTRSQETEQALRESEERLRAVVGSAPDAIVSIDAKGAVIAWNARAEKMFGYTEPEALGKSVTMIIPEHYREPHTQGLERRLPGGAPKLIGQTVELEGLHRDGREFPVELSLAKWETGAGTFYTGIIRDITERKDAEEQMLLHSTALKSAVNSVVITNREGTIEWVNPAFTRITGYSMEEAVGRNPRELVRSGKQDQAFYKDLWDTILSGKGWFGVMVNHRKDGTLYHEEQTITPVINDQGEITHFVAITLDITEQKRVQEELKFDTETLEAQFTIEKILAGPGQLLDRCRRALEELAQISRSDIVILREMTETGTELRLVTQVGAERLGVEVPPIVNSARSIAGQTLTSREPVVVNDYPSDPRALSPHTEAGVKSMAVIPIQLDGAMAGVLTMASLELDHYNPERIRFITTIAAELGRLLENARLREAEYVHSQQLEQRLKELEALNKLFREHLNQRFAVVEAYEQLVKELESEPQNITRIIERAKSVTLPELQAPLINEDEQAQ